MKRNGGHFRGTPAQQYARTEGVDMLNAGDRNIARVYHLSTAQNREERRHAERQTRKANNGARNVR